MSRNLAAANITQSQADHLVPILFGALEFDEGTEYLHTGIGQITWGGNDWTGVGALGSVEPIEESAVLSPFAVRLTISGLATTFVTRTQNSDIYGRPMKVYVGFLSDGDLVADPDIIWTGAMDTLTIKLGNENFIALQAESELKFFESTNGVRFTDEDQQLRFPGDLGFEYLDDMQEASIRWHGQSQRFGNNFDWANFDYYIPADYGG